MRKKFGLVLFVVLVVSCSLLIGSCYGETKKFKDMPDKHWASGAVYNLVKLGITQGFPDGTFRGNNRITRYEVASFLSKLSDAIGGEELGKLKDDLKKYREEIVALKKSSEIPVSGSIGTVLRYGNLLFNDVASHGPVVNYRLLASMMKELGEGTSVKFNFDTMDAGFYGGSSDVARRLVDVEGKFKVDPSKIGLGETGLKNPIEMVLTIGPGAQSHADSTGVLPAEDGVVYRRPDTGIEMRTKLYGIDVKGGYFAVSTADSGKVNTSRFTGALGYTFLNTPIAKNLELTASGDYYVKSPFSAGVKDLRAVINVSAPFSEKVRMDTLLGIGSSKSSGLMVGGRVHLNDLWNTGTKVTLTGSKVGSDYITLASEQIDYAGLDSFNRPLENATVNVGGEVVQSITREWALKGKGDVRLSPDFGFGSNKSKSRATAQVGLAYDIAPSAVFDAFYRVEKDPTISRMSDMTGVGLLYRF